MLFRSLTLIALVASCLVGCASAQLKRNATMIDPGMDRQTVSSIMGPPEDRQFKGTSEAWQYCATGGMSDEFTVVWFQTGQVTGVTNYTRADHVGSCTGAFKSITWEDAPTATLEVRNR